MKRVYFAICMLCVMLCSCAEQSLDRELKRVLKDAKSRYEAYAVDIEQDAKGFPYAFSDGEMIDATGDKMWASGYFPGSLWLLAEWSEDEAVLVRMHSSCMTGDIFGSCRCDCGDQLHKAMEEIEAAGKGVVVYMMQEGRGIGLMNKIKAYKLQEEGLDTVDANIHLGFDADERDYGVGAQILRSLGVHKMRLLTNNPVKRIGLEAYGLEIVENVPIEVVPNEYNEHYLRTKKERMGHTLHF